MPNISSIIDLIHPTASGVGIFLSDQIWVLFDREIDETVLSAGNLIVTGPDFDTWSGPDSALYIDYESIGSEAEILQSPGYHGIVPGTFSFQRIDLIDEDVVSSGLDITGSGLLYRTKAVFTPTNALTPNTEYMVYITGDEDSTDTLKTGVSTRTVYDAVADGANTGSGDVEFTGGYDATYNDIFYIEITTAGSIGTARFKYWRNTNPTAVTGLLARRAGTLLANGVKVLFDEGSYAAGDAWSCVVKPRDTFTGNLVWPFLTGTGSIQVIPSETATSIVGDTVVSSGNDTETTTAFSVSDTSPEDEDSHTTIPAGEYDITVDFDSVIDVATVASGISVEVYTEAVDGDVAIPASGICISNPSVSGIRLTITVASGCLLENNLVTVTLDKTIASTGGTELGSDYQFWFTTTYNPYYCTLKRMRLDIGAYIPNIPDDTVNLAIFHASQGADALTWNASASTDVSQYFSYVRTQWTCCKAQETLLINAIRGEDRLKAKQLGDLKTEYYQAPSDALDRALACLERLELALHAGGAAVQVPQMVVKGELDPDRPNVGRLWYRSDNTQMPASNTRSQLSTSRRYRSGYYPSWRGKGRYG